VSSWGLSAPRCRRSIRTWRRGTNAFASARRNVFSGRTPDGMLAASLRSVEAARAHGRGSPCASGTPGLHSRRVSRSAYHGCGLPTVWAHHPARDDRGGGLGMAEDDPGRESPGLGPEGGQRFFGFDEDISGVAVPAELPILPLRGVVIFPSAIVPLLISREPYFRARIRHLQDSFEPSKDLDAVQAHMVNQFAKFVSMIPYLPDELQVVVMNIKDPGKVTDLIASNLNISLEEKQDLLSTLDVRARLEKLSTILNREIELLELGHKIQSQVQSELNKNQKEFYLRQQMKAIQKELGEGDGKTAEVEELRRRVEEARMPPEALKAAEHELERLRMIPPESAEHTVVRTYLEWLVSLPWSVSTEDNLDLHHARQVLDEDHFDLEKIKDRILEYLAVRQLRKDPKSPILCFVGPPGVGKTSLGKSIAR